MKARVLNLIGTILGLIFLSGCFGAVSDFSALTSEVQIELAEGQSDVADSLPIEFLIKFNIAPMKSSISLDSVVQTGSATGVKFELENTEDPKVLRLTVVEANSFGSITPKLLTGKMKSVGGSTINLGSLRSSSVIYQKSFKYLQRLTSLIPSGTNYQDLSFWGELNSKTIASLPGGLYSLGSSIGEKEHLIDEGDGAFSEYGYVHTFFNGKFYWIGKNSDNDYHLYVSGGTKETTKLLLKMNSSGSSFLNPSTYNSKHYNQFVVHNSELYFLPNDGSNFYLSKINSSTGEVETVATLEAYSTNGARFLGVYDGNILMGIYSAATGMEIWKSDGTAIGTSMIGDIRSGSSGHLSTSRNRVAIGQNGIYYSGSDGTNFGLHVTDGTLGGTEYLAFNTGSGFEDLEFIFNDGTYDYILVNEALYKSDGTSAGTSVVYNAQEVHAAVKLSHGIYFIHRSSGVYYLSKTTGTSGGESLISTLGDSKFENYFSVLDDKIVYMKSGPSGIEPYYYDGTTETLLADINTTGSSLKGEQKILKGSNYVYFVALKDGFDIQIVRSNLSSVEYYDIYSIIGEHHAYVDSNDRMISLHESATESGGVYSIAKDFSSTELIGRAALTGTYMSSFGVKDSKLVMELADLRYGNEIWEFDGGDGSLSLKKDVIPGPMGSEVSSVFKLDTFEMTTSDYFYFSALDPNTLRKNLYFSDYSSFYKMPNNFSYGSNGFPLLYYMAEASDYFYFVAYTNVSTTDSGIVSIKKSDWSPEVLTNSGTNFDWMSPLSDAFIVNESEQNLYFSSAASAGEDASCSDGTAGGTSEIRQDLHPHRMFYEVNGLTIFREENALYKVSNCGTPSVLKTFSEYSLVQDMSFSLAPDKSKLLIAVKENSSGYDLWVTDGTSVNLLNSLNSGYGNDFTTLSFSTLNYSQDSFLYRLDDKVYISKGDDASTVEILSGLGTSDNFYYFNQTGENKAIFSIGNKLYQTDFTLAGTEMLDSTTALAVNSVSGDENHVRVNKADKSYIYYDINSAGDAEFLTSLKSAVRSYINLSGGKLFSDAKNIYYKPNGQSVKTLESVVDKEQFIIDVMHKVGNYIFVSVLDNSRQSIYKIKISDIQ